MQQQQAMLCYGLSIEMTNKSEDSSFSRKGFLKLDWLKRQSNNSRKDVFQTRTTSIRVSIDRLNSLDIGKALKINDSSDVYGVRITEGIIFLSTLCPYDDAGITWKPSDKSEDRIATTGRFYCQRCSTIYDRTGKPTSGPGEASLSQMSHFIDNYELVIHQPALDQLGSENLIFPIVE